jgi:hypothetical protein
MVALAKINKVDTSADKQGGEPRLDTTPAAMPERLSFERIYGRGETADKNAQSVIKTLGLSENATNLDVINALFERYHHDYPAMYRGAQRDFGIAVGTLVDAKEKPFASGDTAHGQGGAGSSGATTTPETPFQTFLRKKGLDGSSTNGELIRKLYERYGSNDRTTYARARRELGINIDDLTSKRDQRIDGTAVVGAPSGERNAPASLIPPSRDPVSSKKTSEDKQAEKAGGGLIYRDSPTRALPWALDQSYEISANPTIFGGPGDSLTKYQKGSINGQPLVSAKPEEEVYIAWFMPDQEKLYGLPDTSRIFGPQVESWRGERLAKANEALRHFMVEVTRVDEDGNRHTVLAQPIDRGPNERFYKRESNPLPRIDGSSKLWENLGMLDKTSGPNKAANQVKLTIRLVPKDPTKSLNDLLVDLGVEKNLGKKQLTARSE